MIFLFKEGLPILKHLSIGDFTFGTEWYPTSGNPRFGIFPLIIASLSVTALASLIAIPFSLAVAIYLSEIASKSAKEIFKPMIEIIASIPSVVIGFFGMVVVAPFLMNHFDIDSGLNLFNASIMLAFMVIPIIASISEDAISSVPLSLKEASYALGATRWQTIFHITIPAALSGIWTAIILGISRVIGETMVVLMVAGGAALMPHGYPFTKHQNLDKFDKSLFYVNPFDKPIVMQDYLGGKVCAVLDTSGMDNPDEIRRTRIWRNGKPYPIITEVPNQEEVQARLEKCYSGIVQFFQDSAEAIKREFPNEEAGFILAGGLPSICFDNWLSDPKCYWLFKTDVDLFTYGNSTETRKRIFKILFDNLKRFEKKNTHYYVWNSVFTMFRRILYDISLKEADSHHLEEYHLDKTIQIINTNSRDGFEVIMNFDTSNIQIGWDCHKGWIASPFWSLYTPRREALVVRYNVRSPRFVKTLYRGYNLKIIMPKSLLLMPKGLSYSYLIDKNKLIELIPDPKSTYPDDLKILRHARKGHIDPDYVDTSTPGPNGEVHAYAHFGSQPQGDMNNRKFKIRIDGEEKFLSLGGEDKPLDRNQDYANLNNVIDRIKYNGKFKNGFDAYVREQYFIYEHLGKDLKQLDDGEWKLLDIKGLTIEEVLQKVGGLKEARFVLRDCKIIFDPKASSTRFHGTDKFKFSLRASILETRKDLTPNYTLVDRFNKGILVNAKPTRNYLKDPHYVTEAMVENNNSIQSETTDLSTYREINKALLRTLYTFPIMMEGIIQIKAENRENSGTEEPQIYYAIKDGWHYVLKPLPVGEEPESEPEIISYRQFKHYQNHGLSKEQAKPRFFKVSSVKADFDIDNVDLHERFYSDEERAALPVYSFDQWQDIRIGKIKLDENVVAIRIRTPVVIKETLFLDQADWTIDVENVLRDYKHLMFNCLCYQNFTTIKKEGITGGEIMVYRSFMIYE